MSKFHMKFLMLLVVSVTMAFFLIGNIRVGQSAESANTMKEVALHFLEDVADFNLDGYNVTSYRSVTPDPIVQDRHPGHVETWVDMSLSGGNGELKITTGFMDDKFYYFYLDEGIPVTKTRAVNLVDTARIILEHYRIQFNATYCAQLAPLLQQTITLDQEHTIERNEAVLEILPGDKTVTFVWRPKIDGIEMQKGLSIRVDKNGFLMDLWDWCSVLHVANTEVNVSREDAIDMAFDLAQEHADEIGAKIDSYDTALTLWSGRGDCFTLYPIWEIEINYDKVYGSFFGYFVSVWADTGEVYHAHSQGSYVGETNRPPIPWPIILLATTLVAVPTALTLYRTRKRSRR